MNELLDRYRVERNEDITYAAFQSPFELLTEIEKGIRPDILFLDVVMPGQMAWMWQKRSGSMTRI